MATVSSPNKLTTSKKMSAELTLREKIAKKNKLKSQKQLQQSATLGGRKPGRPKKTIKTRSLLLPTRKRPYRAAAAKSRKSDDSQNPAALLDMLAEVASATLEKNQSISKPRKRTRRGSDLKSSPETKTRKGTAKGGNEAEASVTNKKSLKKSNVGDPAPDQHLNLDQIRMLSNKQLLQYFSELTADEIRRNYSYMCFLMPDECQQKYTSFGSDTRARMNMKSHLLEHIAELLTRTNTDRSLHKTQFTAEPLSVRKRRLMGIKQVEPIATQKKPNKGGCKPPMEVKIVSKSGTKFTPTKKWKTPAILERKQTPVKKQVKVEVEDTNVIDTIDDEEEMLIKQSLEVMLANKRKEVTTAMTIDEDESIVQSSKRRRQKIELVDDNGDVVAEEIIVGGDSEDEQQLNVNDDDEETVAEQPLHDHSYTTADGGKNLPGHYKDEEEEYFQDDFDNYDGDSEVRVVVGDLNLSKGIVISSETDQSTANSEVTFRTKQAEMALRQLEAIRLLQIQKNKKLLTNSNTYSSAMTIDVTDNNPNVVRIDVGSIDDMEEDGDANEDDEAAGAVVTIEAYDSDDAEQAENSLDKGSPEWERKLALKYIRMLRLKKKDEHVPLVCRICEGQKCFTAQATLMYHYRSHAGIKPFVCSICQTTFTRQHSLNYHMLIHNNKSRFTCGDCGRQFRHPSHFKEHLRRHTGETPFECTDCGVRFKTRNTYKRHLKTRHGKLLTVNGIVTLSNEEFMKVKTNPKKRTSQKAPKRDAGGTQFPEELPLMIESVVSADDLIGPSGLRFMSATIEEEQEEDDEDTIAARSLEQQDIVEAAVQGIIQEEGRQEIGIEPGEEEQEQDQDDNGEGEEIEGEVSYTFYSIGVGTDPLNGKEIILLEAVPSSSA